MRRTGFEIAKFGLVCSSTIGIIYLDHSQVSLLEREWTHIGSGITGLSSHNVS